ncbi:hypothetical protein SBOR_7245 [Sclerotinia borealis F-4128]|uniref:DUF4185 domain-containing protein n=1 Tax=Sclerotinia borealis (strain F-4128) TaxID=1432307 RepID=W9CCY3_SCLBF|nr:hypothetical protein SBOR_7245 [Sclerotinia borealis F-4128]
MTPTTQREMPEIQQYVVWPPMIKHIVPMGHLYDESGNSYPRIGGRSSALPNGHVLFQFNNTFCHNAAGQFLGRTDSTLSFLTNPTNPVMSRYLAPPETNIEISERQIPSLFKRFEDELDKKNDNKVFWATGGIAWYLITGAAAYGWTFFEHRGIRKDGSTFLIAPSEPRLGTFSVLSDGKYLYAYGHKGGDHNEDYDVVLGRVPLELANARACWEYWGGERGWAKNHIFSWPILKNYLHGQIFNTKLFGEASPYRFGLVGCTRTGDSKLMFGRAVNPWGPFEIVELMKAYPMGHIQRFAYTAHMFAHPWAFSENKGDLMVTWSEGGSAGNIVAVKIRFEQGIGRAQPKELRVVQRIEEERDNDNIALSELQLNDELYSFERYEKDGEQKTVITTAEKKNVFEKAATAFGKLCNNNAA